VGRIIAHRIQTSWIPERFQQTNDTLILSPSRQWLRLPFRPPIRIRVPYDKLADQNHVGGGIGLPGGFEQANGKFRKAPGIRVEAEGKQTIKGSPRDPAKTGGSVARTVRGNNLPTQTHGRGSKVQTRSPRWIRYDPPVVFPGWRVGSICGRSDEPKDGFGFAQADTAVVELGTISLSRQKPVSE
jgi:hypothetical protein